MENVTLTNEDLSKFSEMGLVTMMKHSQLTYSSFCVEIRRRISAGEYVAPYHKACAEL